jgi:hypothetical protein
MLILACLAAVTACTTATATEPDRVVNGHAFMPSEVIPSPFALSSFTSLTGGGLAFDVKTPFVDVDGQEIGTLEGDVAFMALGFRYQQRFGSWFAARAAFVGGARIGVDEQSVLAQGVTGTYVFSFGGIARLFQSAKVIVSTSLDFSQTEAVGLDPYGFAQRIIEEGLDQDNELVKTEGVSSGKLSLLAGWAPLHWLGLNGYVDTSRGRFTEIESETKVGGGLAVGVDLKNLDIVPIGVQLVARTSAITNASSDLASRSWAYGLGVLYTGWDDFSIGVEFAMNTFERRGGGDDFESFVGTINLKYWP